jgi:hypothetical protein
MFKRYKDYPMNLEIKVNDDELIDKVEDLIKSYNREEITVLTNFNKSNI